MLQLRGVLYESDLGTIFRNFQISGEVLQLRGVLCFCSWLLHALHLGANFSDFQDSGKVLQLRGVLHESDLGTIFGNFGKNSQVLQLHVLQLRRGGGRL